MKRSGVLDVVEAAYALEQDEEGWLQGLAQAAGGLMDEGSGVHVVRVDLSRPDRVHDPVLVGGSEAWARVWRQNWWEPFLTAFDREQLLYALGFGTVFWSTHFWEAASRRIPTYTELFEKLGSTGWGAAFGRYTEAPADGRLFYPESLNVLAVDVSQRGIAIFANRQHVADGPLDRATLATWSRIAGHITAAVRLRARLASAPAAPEAILRPDGRVEHAEGEARGRLALAALREAARQVDRARTKRVRDTGEALQQWQALQAGRWSLIDVFERDGRRYYLARPNEPAPPPRAALGGLTPRERQVVSLLALGRSNKAIAYELGLSTSTISTLLRRAMLRTGAETVTRLAAWARAELLPASVR